MYYSSAVQLTYNWDAILYTSTDSCRYVYCAIFFTIHICGHTSAWCKATPSASQRKTQNARVGSGAFIHNSVAHTTHIGLFLLLIIFHCFINEIILYYYIILYYIILYYIILYYIILYYIILYYFKLANLMWAVDIHHSINARFRRM